MKKCIFIFCAVLLAASVIGSCSKDDDLSSKDNAPSNVEAVDLGLSVKWANCNIGATSPEGYGDYFAWGETSAKSTYTWENYKWGTHYALTKYCFDSEYGEVDNKTTLDNSDDAARANWGGRWRIPTLKEWEELKANCKLTWTKVNGVYGLKVTATNGNYIFLPAAGYHENSRLYEKGTYGTYWGSSLDDYVCNACSVAVGSYGMGIASSTRFRGHSVRAVCR